MKKYGTLIRKIRANGSSVSLSHEFKFQSPTKHVFTVTFIYTSFDNIGNIDSLTYFNMKDAYDMFKVFGNEDIKSVHFNI